MRTQAAGPQRDRRIKRDCPNCGTGSAGAADVAYGVPEWPMKRCRKCQLVYLEWVPDLSRLSDELAWTDQRKKNWDRRLKKQPIFARLDLMTLWRTKLFYDATAASSVARYAKKGPVLDVGCGGGKKFAQLAEGFIPHGIEIEAKTAAKANDLFSARGGRAVHADGVSGLAALPRGYFTGVVLWSYLEHEARPLEALEGVRNVIRHDGVVVVKVPNYGSLNRRLFGRWWPGFRHPDHVQYFTPQTLKALARRAGFGARFRLYGRLPFNDNMYAILRPMPGDASTA